MQQPGPPLWRSVISPGSFTECGKLGVPILTARLPVARIKERWALYDAGLDAGGHDETTKARLLAQSALWRNVYVAESDAQAEDELRSAARRDAQHMMHVREAYNPPDFTPGPETLNPWTDPKVDDAVAIPYVLETGSLYGSPARVREQVAEIARRRRPAPALPDRLRRHEPRAEHRLDAAVRRAGHAGVRRLRAGPTVVRPGPKHQLSWLSGRRCACATMAAAPRSMQRPLAGS